MKYTLGDEKNKSTLKQEIYTAIELNEDELKIQIVDEAGDLIANATIEASQRKFYLDELTFSETYKQVIRNQVNPDVNYTEPLNLKKKLLADINSVLTEINQKYEVYWHSCKSCIEQLQKYRELFTLYSIPENSGFQQFLKKNAQYVDVFMHMKKHVDARANLQIPLQNLFTKGDTDTISAYLINPTNISFLKFLVEELSQFEPIYQSWESYKQEQEQVDEESYRKLRERFARQRQIELNKIINDEARLKDLIIDTLAVYFNQFPEKAIEKKYLGNTLDTLLKDIDKRKEFIDLVTQEKVDPLIHNKNENLDTLILNINNWEKPLNLQKSKIHPELDFNNRKLQCINLNNMRMRECNFSQANLNAATATECHFFNCNFSKATLINTNLNNSNFSYANFTGADLSGADFTGAVLDNVCWDGVTLSTTTKIDWNKYGADILLSNLQAIGNKNDLSLPQKKAMAKKWVGAILPQITSNKAMLKLVDIIERKHSTYAYLREEQAMWRFNSHGNTSTWSTIIGSIKERMDKIVSSRNNEKYTSEECQTFLKIMNEHRGRGFGPVTHAKYYEHLSDQIVAQEESIPITKKM